MSRIVCFECYGAVAGNHCNSFETDKWDTMQDGINILVRAKCPKCDCTTEEVFTIEDMFQILMGG